MILYRFLNSIVLSPYFVSVGITIGKVAEFIAPLADDGLLFPFTLFMNLARKSL